MQEWENERYTMGLADLSQTLRAVLQAQTYYQEDGLVDILRNGGIKDVPDKIDDFVAERIIKQLLLDSNLSSKIEVGVLAFDEPYSGQHARNESRSKQPIDFQTDIWNISEAILGLN